MVSDVLVHYFFNNQCLTFILPRLFEDIAARVTPKFLLWLPSDGRWKSHGRDVDAVW